MCGNGVMAVKNLRAPNALFGPLGQHSHPLVLGAQVSTFKLQPLPTNID